jgi:tetratricopeptide (TPR) repeat protein
MLIPRPKRKKNKQDTNPEFRKGLILLQDKLYKQAMVELKIALENNPSTIQPELEKLYQKYQSGENIEIALTIGLVLFQVRKEESLALTLGNYSRQLGNYKQANNLYRHALKINRSSKLAFYNLAASMGRVEKYDDEIKANIDKYFTAREYVIPQYLDNNKTLLRLNEELVQIRRNEKIKRFDEISLLLHEKEASGDKKGLEELNLELNTLTESQDKVSYNDLKAAVQSLISKSQKEELEESEAKKFHHDVFNFGLFALNKKDYDAALDYFLVLKSREIDLKNLDLCIALLSDINGQRDEALRLMNNAFVTNPVSRLVNVNLALLHEKNKNRLLSYKFKAIASSLLEKSNGLIHDSEILEQANTFFKKTDYKRALRLYKIVAQDSEDAQAWLNIGEIHLQQKRQLEALDAIKEAKRIDPDAESVRKKLDEVHQQICQRAEELFNDSKFSQAAVVYERALGLKRTLDILDKLITIYRKLGKNQQAQDLYEEQQGLFKIKQEELQEERRQDQITQGKLLLKQKKYDAAINSFEGAFGMKADKDVFVFLAHIYKQLNRKGSLRTLVDRWNALQERKTNR